MSNQPSREAWLHGEGAECKIPFVPRPRRYRLVLLGPPGVGKGTQALLLGERVGSCHLSTGDLFRASSCLDKVSPAMATAQEAMKRGELVSDDLVLSMIQERANCLRCGGGFLLDGVPRTLSQAEGMQAMLDELGVEIDAVIAYELPLEEIVDRLGGRRTCGSCKAVYHVTANPPREAGVCDRCGGELLQREDDKPETIRVRMQAYTAETQPLIDYYGECDKLIAIDSHGAPDEILVRTLEALKSRLGLEEL